MTSPVPTRRRSAPFRPRFTLMILYFALLFVALSLLMILPDLVALIRESGTAPPGDQPSPEELQARASAVARAAMQGKVLPAAALSVLVTGVLTWYRRLPGLREG